MDIAPQFDLVFINLTPENLLLDLALAASRWLMIPTRTDSASIDGMRGVTDHFVQVRQTNSQIQLLRAVLFATTRNATRIHTNAYNQIERAFGSKSPSFRSFIRYSEALAQEARYPDQGKVAHELETLAKDQPAWWEALKSGEKRHRISLTTSTVSTDYSNVCLEMINIISKAEKTA